MIMPSGAAILLRASKLASDWLAEILGFTVASSKNVGVARFCQGNNFVMKAHIAIHNTLKGSHIHSNSKNNIYSILEKNELLGSRFARESCSGWLLQYIGTVFKTSKMSE